MRVALHHRTRYEYDRPVMLSPHEVRLRPAPHTRTVIERYAMDVLPANRLFHWLQDPYGNWVARLLFPEATRELRIDVDLVADLSPVNPFDFFVDETAVTYPFRYTPQMARELTLYLEKEPAGPRFGAWLDRLRARLACQQVATIDFLVEVNRRVREDVDYRTRMEAGVQPPETTIERAQGSCRDSAWLLVQVMRHLGIGARFVSGYLIQLAKGTADGPQRDSGDLHAWCEAYIPGAGWIGLDATSGLLCSEGHIPLACSAWPGSAAPVTGLAQVANTRFDFAVDVTRVA